MNWRSSFLRLIPLVLLVLTAAGTLGFRVLTGAGWLDCLYMAVITITTVGYREVVPVTAPVKIFVILYLVAGLGVFTYSVVALGQWLLSAELQHLWERRRMSKDVNRLEDHFIVCGAGRMGRTIARYLSQRQRPFVIVDRDEELLRDLYMEHGWLYVEGDCTDDDTLIRAGIERARALAIVLGTDADNLFVVLSARLLNPQLEIIARANDEKSMLKMERAGANRVINPLSSGAVKIARFMLHPSIEDFLEVTDNRGNDLELADIHIGPDSPYVNKRLMDTDLRQRGVMVVGIRRANGERLMPPPGTAVILPGDCLFAFGTTEAVNSIISEDGSRDAGAKESVLTGEGSR